MFQKALPVFPKGFGKQPHIHAAFTAEIEQAGNTVLHVTAATFYRVSVNGVFVASGPARTAKGYAREDVLHLDDYLKSGKNQLLIEVLGHYCKSMTTVKQPSFLQAEVCVDNNVIAYTGKDFRAYVPKKCVQKVERYSGQRLFAEVWDYSAGYHMTAPEFLTETECLEVPPIVIDRVAPYAYCENVSAARAASVGRCTECADKEVKRSFFSFVCDEDWGCFDWEEIPFHPYEWVQKQDLFPTAKDQKLPLRLCGGEYALLDFGRIETGFFRFSASVKHRADVVIAFSEDIGNEKFAFTDMHAQTVLEFLLSDGKTPELLSFEPYVARFALVAVKSGELLLEDFGIKTFCRDVRSVEQKSFDNPVLDAIYRAAVRTYSHNALDIFMDCPSRERAGWLCDSYFTAKAEMELFGEVKTEQAFLENFTYYKNEGDYPDGMLPMCFPTDIRSEKRAIPQWNLWYLIELEEYLNERNPTANREIFRKSVDGLLAFFARYENADGLLERLPEWNFVEWSVANQWTWDVNYPTNLLYAQALESVYRIYGDASLLQKAERIRKTAVEQSFDGTMFLDHAVRDDKGVLVRQADCSEACQYYAILFGGIDIHSEKYAELKRRVLHAFGATRREQHPEVVEINAFIGAYLRLEALLKMKEYRLLLRDIEEFFGCMEQETGTLWEYRQHHGSRDHGFASYVVKVMNEAYAHLKQEQ